MTAPAALKQDVSCGDAPARGLFFLLLFLWTSKEKVDPNHKKFFQAESALRNYVSHSRFCVPTLWQRRGKLNRQPQLLI